MSTFDTLPVILVSAINETAATELISDLIDNDVTADFMKETQCLDRVWRLVNKYYTVNVRVHALTDHGRLEVKPDAIEAHVIHITDEEVSDSTHSVARAEARAAGGGGAWRRAAVRLLLTDDAAEPGALRAWAAAQRAELVPLRAAPRAPDDAAPRAPGDAAPRAPGDAAPRAPDDAAPRAPEDASPFGAERGVARARAALHAHAWRGLTRTDRAAPLPEATLSSSCATSDESAGSDLSDEEAEERRAVEHAEAFAAALGALGPALAARAPASHDAHHAAGRREHAEALLLAFCRALGLDPAAC